jgi:broad specificity phosphatase PhoE
MTELVLARHGETVWHAENRYAGTSDIALTPRGQDQARELARWAAGAGLAAVWCSPLRRARETAQAIHAATAQPLEVDDRLVELAFGQAEGLTRAEMDTRFPAALAAFRDDPVRHPLPGGEDPHAALARVLAAIDDITAAHRAGRVLVVAHTTLIRLALCHLLGLPLANYRRTFPALGNATLSEVRIEPGHPPALLRYNAPAR